MTFLDKIKYAPFFLLSLIPFRILYIFSDILYVFMYHLVRYRKPVVRSNLKLAFPTLNENELLKIEKNFYRHFCDVIVECVKIVTIRPDNLLSRFKIINPEIITGIQQEHKSFILYSGHLGNWEWFLAMPLYLKIKSVALYLPLRNTYFNELVKCIRQRFGVEVIEAVRSYKALLNFSNNKVETSTIFIADQSPHRGAVKHWASFFGRETAFNTGINAMALKLKHIVLFPHFRKVSRGHYEIELVTIWDGSSTLYENEIIDRFAEKLERAIKETPHIWLWTHRRWKLKKEEVEVKN